jgi:hypothetical protein
MLNPLTSAGRFYSWWSYSLLSCLPEKWFDYFTGAKANFDLIIVHQANSIIIMTDRGVQLDSIPLSGVAQIDLGNLPAEESVVGRFSNTQLRQVEKLASLQDPPLSLGDTRLDLDLTDHTQPSAEENLDIVLDDGTGNQEDEHDPTLFDPTELSNVFSLKSLRDNDDTLVLDDGKQTSQFLESVTDEDTVIIKSDQGKLLQFEAAGTASKDSTLLFRNQGGKIKQLDPSEFEVQESGELVQNLDGQVEDMVAGTDPTTYAAVLKLLEIYRGNKKCLYLLPDSRVLNLNLTYPIEAMQDIESVLRYDLEKHIPVSEQEVRYFYALKIDASGEKFNAEVAVIKSEEYELLNLILEPFLKTGLLCTTENFYRKYGSTINFLEPKTEQGWRTRIKVSNLLLTFNWLLLPVLLATPFLTLNQGLEVIEEKSAAEIRRVKELVSEFNLINTESRFSSQLSEHLNKAHRSVELLAVLSSNINSQAWLHQFSYKNNEIKIKGEAESATSVSDDLNNTDLFQSIKFVSSIVKNSRSGKETFELLLRLKPDA